MKKVCNKKKYISALICLLAVLLLGSIGVFGHSETAEAACTMNCSKCNGLGYTRGELRQSSTLSATAKKGTGNYAYCNNTYLSSFPAKSQQNINACTYCGGEGSATRYSTQSDGGGADSIWVWSYYVEGSGKVNTCNENKEELFTTNGRIDDVDNTPVTNGGKYIKCSVCGSIRRTEYLLTLKTSTGIESVSGGGWYQSGNSATVNCTVKTGYTFSKWGDGDTGKSWSTTMDKPKTFTAYATPNTYTVSYNANGGTGSMAASTATYDSDFQTRKNTYTKAGYVFAGWNESPDGTGVAWSTSAAGVFESGKSWKWTYTKDIVLYAQWSTAPYTISYDANSGVGEMDDSTVFYGVNFMTSPNAFRKAGYTFNGWNEKADGTGVAWTLNSEGVFESNKSWKWTYTKDITLYAQWKPNTYKVSYNANGGTGAMHDSEAVYGTDFITRQNTFKRTGYTFNGWNEKADGTGTVWSLASVLFVKFYASTFFTLFVPIIHKFLIIMLIPCSQFFKLFCTSRN